MATRPPADDADNLDNLDDIDDLNDADGGDEQGGDDDGQDEEEITFAGDEEDGDDTAADLPKRLRDEIKKRDRENAALKKRVAELDKPAAPADVGPRPTREEYDWDDDKYDAAVDEWNAKKLRAEAAQDEPNDGEAEAKQDVERLNTGIASLTYADAKDVVPQAMEALSAADQFIIASAAKDPGKLIYALAKNPARLSALLDIKNPVKKIAEIARMEMQMTVRSKAPPPPENVRSGDARVSVGADKEEARLEKEAERTGDRTKLIRYRSEKNQKAA